MMKFQDRSLCTFLKITAQKNQRPYYLIFMEEGVMALGIFMYQTCVQLLIRQTLYWYIQMDITVYGTVRFPQIQLLKTQLMILASSQK